MSESNEVEHTPTPWTAEPPDRFDIEDGDATWMIEGPDCEDIARVWVDEVGEETAQANAEFIVRACNAHDDLLAVARESIRRCACGGVGYVERLDYDSASAEFTVASRPECSICRAARAAVAKATGQGK